MLEEKYIEGQDALFHYTKTATAIEHILTDRILKFSVFGDFKDPYEYGFKFFSSHNEPPVETSDILWDETSSTINKMLRYDCRVLCFCSNTEPVLVLSEGTSNQDVLFSQGWQRSRMWSQYGDGHSGVCLVFSRSRIEERVQELSRQVEKYECRYVKYLQDFGFYPVVDKKALTSKEGVRQCSIDYIKNNFELLFRKHIDYRDEAEFRVVVLDPAKNVEYFDVSQCLRAVIVGDRIPDVYIPFIKHMCNDLKVELLQAKWTKSDPQWVLKIC